MIHVIQEGMTILNTTQGRIIENREKINDIIDVIHNVSHKLVTVSTTVGVLKSYIHGYNHLGLAIAEVKDMLAIAGDYLGQLQLRLNMLSMGHLSPSVIDPNNLRLLLSDIKSKLPPHLRLPKDEKKDIWQYYQFLTCSTVLEKDRILVILNVPLMDLTGKFDIYKVHNLLVTVHTMTASSNPNSMVAHFDLETHYFAVNKDKIKYSLLDNEGVSRCTNPLIDFCELKNPIFPINLSNLCIIALFTDRDWKSTCSTIVKPNTRLPLASYISDGIWIVASIKKFRLTVRYPKGKVTDKDITPPLITVPLQEGCSASSDYFTLTPIYTMKSVEMLGNSFTTLFKSFTTLNVTIWQPFHYAISKFSSIKLLEKLETIKQISMNKLIEETQLLNIPDAEFVFPSWGISLTTGLGGVILGVLVFVYYKYRRGSCLARKNSTRRDYYAVTKGFPLVSAPVAESEFDDLKGAIASAPMYQEEFKWPTYHKDKPFTWKKEAEEGNVKETM
jgi:hypothetical protein